MDSSGQSPIWIKGGRSRRRRVGPLFFRREYEVFGSSGVSFQVQVKGIGRGSCKITPRKIWSYSPLSTSTILVWKLSGRNSQTVTRSNILISEFLRHPPTHGFETCSKEVHLSPKLCNSFHRNKNIGLNNWCKFTRKSRKGGGGGVYCCNP